MRWLALLAALGCTPSGGGSGGAGDSGGDARGVDDQGISDAVVGDARLGDGGAADAAPVLTCEEALARLADEARDTQPCVLGNQCIVVGGPQSCDCGPVVGPPEGYVLHFNQHRVAVPLYLRALEVCGAEVREVCETQPSVGRCDDSGRCQIDPGGLCVPDAGAPPPDAGGEDPSCDQLAAEVRAFTEDNADCAGDDECTVVGGTLGCECNTHQGPAEGYAVRLDAAGRARMLLDLMAERGCPGTETCGRPAAEARGGVCDEGGRCVQGESPAPCE